MKHSLTYRDFYKEYKKEVENPAIKSPAEMTKVMKLFFEGLQKELILENYFLRLPNRLGFLRISKNKYSKGAHEHRKINFQRSKELKTIVRYTNKHSNGYFFLFDWMKNVAYCKFRNRYYYGFKAVRGSKESGIGKRGLSACIMERASDPYVRDYDAPTKVSSYGDYKPLKTYLDEI